MTSLLKQGRVEMRRGKLWVVGLPCGLLGPYDSQYEADETIRLMRVWLAEDDEQDVIARQIHTCSQCGYITREPMSVCFCGGVLIEGKNND